MGCEWGGEIHVPSYTCYGWNTSNGLRSGARATAGGGRSGSLIVAAARLRVWLRALLEEGDALVDVLRVPDGRRRDAGEVVREEAAGSVVVAVGGAVAVALLVRGAAGEECTGNHTASFCARLCF